MDKNNNAVSLIEVLLVMAILLLIIAGVYFALRTQVGKGQDAKRKDDLERMRVAFEDYYNDYGCYPLPTQIDDCGSDELSPYLTRIPCDPVTREPYKMIVNQYGADACPSWYKIYTQMENTDDITVEKLGCQNGCEIDGGTYHYGISSPNVFAGEVPQSSFTCDDGSPGDAIDASCGCDYEGQCTQCTCDDDEKVVCPAGLADCAGPVSGTCYCCHDPVCELD
jgi:prepilin-type N-terminal cleavage/methylation domain-containing protein